MNARAVDRRLELLVVPSQPYLGVRLSGLEAATLGHDPLLATETRRCLLHVTNHGQAPVRSLLVKSHGSAIWVCLGRQDSGTTGVGEPGAGAGAGAGASDSVGAKVEGHGTAVQDPTTLVGLDGSLLRVALPGDGGLAPGATVGGFWGNALGPRGLTPMPRLGA